MFIDAFPNIIREKGLQGNLLICLEDESRL